MQTYCVTIIYKTNFFYKKTKKLKKHLYKLPQICIFGLMNLEK